MYIASARYWRRVINTRTLRDLSSRRVAMQSASGEAEAIHAELLEDECRPPLAKRPKRRQLKVQEKTILRDRLCQLGYSFRHSADNIR